MQLEVEWEKLEKQKAIDRKVAAFDAHQEKSTKVNAERAVTRQATKRRKEEEALAQIAAQEEKRAATNAKSAATKAANKELRDAAAEQKAANEAGQKKKWGNVTGMGMFNKG